MTWENDHGNQLLKVLERARYYLLPALRHNQTIFDDEGTPIRRGGNFCIIPTKARSIIQQFGFLFYRHGL